MDKKTLLKKLAAVILAQLLAILTLAAFFIGGLLLKDSLGKSVAIIGFFTVFGVLLIMFLVQLGCAGRIKRSFVPNDIARMNDTLLKKQGEIRSDYGAALRRMNRTSLLCKAYVTVTLLLQHALVFFAGAETKLTMLAIIFVYFFVANIYVHFLAALFIVPEPLDEGVLSREEYGELYALAKRAMETAGATGKVSICADNSLDFSIARYGDIFQLCIGCPFIYFFTENELYSILLHEFAHHSREYTPKADQGIFRRFIEFDGDNAFSAITDLVLAYPSVKYMLERELFDYLGSVLVESMADSIVKDKGESLAMASALAKTALLDDYQRVRSLYTESPVYEGEAPPKDIAERTVREIKRAMTDNLEPWLASLEKEIQPRNATHPIYRERRNAIGVSADEVKVSFDVGSDSLDKIREKIVGFAGAVVASNMEEDYEVMRDRYYLASLKTVEAWEADKEGCSLPRKLAAVTALSYLTRMDEAEALADELIEAECGVRIKAGAYFFKSRMLLLRGDEAGIEMMYKAVDGDIEYADQGLLMLGTFLCRYGLQPQLDEYRERATAYHQKRFDQNERFGALEPRDKLFPEEDSERLKGYTEEILKLSDRITEIRVCRKIVGEESARYFCITIPEKEEDDSFSEAMDIYSYIDSIDDGRNIMFLNNPYIVGLMSRVNGTLVYSKAEPSGVFGENDTH